MPAMRPNWRSSGVATEEAMVSGLAPGKLRPTEIVGKSTCGSGRYREQPESDSARQRHRDGQQGRRYRPMDKWLEIFMD